MSLSSDLLSQLVKATSSNNDKNTNNAGSTVYGTIVIVEDKTYVQIDGSQQLTPVTSTADYLDGERVTVQIKDHTAIVTGNLSSPAARKDEVVEIGDKVTKFDTVIADLVDAKAVTAGKLEATTASIDKLYAAVGEVDKLISEDVTITGKLTAAEGQIENLKTTKIDATVVEAKYATIEELKASNAKINNLETTYVSTEVLNSRIANIDEINSGNISAENAIIENLSSKFANIDFANIGEAAIQKLFADSGIIKDLIMSDGNVTGELVGVTIKGDLIEAGTLKADSLLVKGEDGLYYALNVTENGDPTVTEKYTEEELQNGLLGSVIIAKSITAEKVAVDDLVAFDATIGGFTITENAIHSNAKNEADNSTPGIYMDKDGQFAVGDGDSYIKFAKDENDQFKLVIMLSGGKSVEDAINDGITDLRIGGRNLIRNSDNLIFDGYYFANSANSAVLGIGELGDFVLGMSEIESTDYGVDTVDETGTEEGSSEDYKPQGFVDGMVLHDYHLINMENAIIKALSGVATARITTITLLATNWDGSGTIYSQAVAVDGVTANSKVDLLPSPEQLNELLLAEISLTAANSDCAITVFALGSAPTTDLELQAMITEVIIPEVIT